MVLLAQADPLLHQANIHGALQPAAMKVGWSPKLESIFLQEVNDYRTCFP
jgi:hypothetical protein